MAGRLLIGVYIGSDTDRENRATRTVLLVRKVIVGIAIALSNDTRESVRRESGFVQAGLSEIIRRGGPRAANTSPVPGKWYEIPSPHQSSIDPP